MNAIDIILLNFSEIRRRSIKVWVAIPESNYNWKPDDKAMSIFEMIEHVLEAEHLFHEIINRRGNLGDYESPWEKSSSKNVEDALEFAEAFRNEFMSMIKGLSENDLETIRIERSEVGQSKSLGDYLNRIAYHESVHTGQILDYIRTAGLKMPNVWD